jgi:hypothetical protein
MFQLKINKHQPAIAGIASGTNSLIDATLFENNMEIDEAPLNTT